MTIGLLVCLASVVCAFQRSPSTARPTSTTALQVKTAEKKRTPWEFFRFLKQANFFSALKPKFMRSSAVAAGAIEVRPGAVLWSKDDKKGIEWGPLDDVVMGGASKTDLTPGESFTGAWTGIVTTANNGGFAGIRTKLLSPFRDASSCSGILLKIKGDGQRYKLIARDDEDWNGMLSSLPKNLL